MKLYHKLFSIVFAMLIFASQSGMAFNVHYCKGVLESISYLNTDKVCDADSMQTTKKCCADKKENQHNKCCKDTKIDLKKISSNDLIVKSFNFELSPFYFTSFLLTTTHNLLPKSSIIKVDFIKINFASNAPPLYKLYCKYILYA